jgi:PAS domain S-box-containing protein
MVLESSILDAIPHAVLFQMNRRIIFANDAVENVFGWKASELIGQKTRILYGSGEDDTGVGIAFYSILEEKRALKAEIPCRRKDGQEITCRVSATVIGGNAQEERIVIVCEDITEHKRSEEALKESERRLAEIIDFLPDATFVLDQRGRIIAWNRAIEEMTGFRAEEMLGKEDFEHAIPFYGEKRPILIDLVNMPSEVIEAKYHLIHREKGILMGDADCPMVRRERRFLSGWATPIYNLKGEIVGAIESIRDMTEKKLADEEREKLIGELREAIMKIKMLSGLLPICASCKKIRDDKGYWNQIEVYIRNHSEADFSHSICPECISKLYPGYHNKDIK